MALIRPTTANAVMRPFWVSTLTSAVCHSSQEARRDQMVLLFSIEVGVRGGDEFVTSQLFDHKLIEWHVCIDRSNHPVSILV